MIDHNHFICHFIFGGHLLNIPNVVDVSESRHTCLIGHKECQQA